MVKRRVNLFSILAHFECIIAFTLTNVEMGSALSESAWHIPGGYNKTLWQKDLTINFEDNVC